MAEIAVSVVATVLNESKSIIPLLSSLKKQTLKPSEVLIIDGGSTDDTRDKIVKYAYDHPKLKVRLIEESGNISHGRNVGVENSKNDIVAMIDAGCIAKPNWLKKITEPFLSNKHIVVAGFYEMKATNICQKAVAPFHGVTAREFDPRSFLPSARSIAFNKSVWKAVGGFDEHLVRAGEDTLFNYKIMSHNIPIVRRGDALVEWTVPATFKETVKKFYWYAKGDAQTGIWWHPAQKLHTHNIKIATIFIRYIVFLLLLLGGVFMPFFYVIFVYVFVGYTSWSIWKLHNDVDSFLALLFVPFVQIASDISIMLGFGSEILFSHRRKHV